MRSWRRLPVWSRAGMSRGFRDARSLNAEIGQRATDGVDDLNQAGM